MDSFIASHSRDLEALLPDRFLLFQLGFGKAYDAPPAAMTSARKLAADGKVSAQWARKCGAPLGALLEGATDVWDEATILDLVETSGSDYCFEEKKKVLAEAGRRGAMTVLNMFYTNDPHLVHLSLRHGDDLHNRTREWLLAIHVHPTGTDDLLAAERGDIPALLWLRDQKPVFVGWNMFVSEHAVTGGCVETLSFLLSNNAKCWPYLMRTACGAGHIGVMEFLYSYGFGITERDVAQAAGTNRIDVLAWTSEKLDPSMRPVALVRGAHIAAMEDAVRSLDWIVEQGTSLNMTDIANTACENGADGAMEWAVSRGGINPLVHLPSVIQEFRASSRIWDVASHEFAVRAAAQGNYDVLSWCHEMETFDAVEVFRLFTETLTRRNEKTLKWLVSHGMITCETIHEFNNRQEGVGFISKRCSWLVQNLLGVKVVDGMDMSE